MYRQHCSGSRVIQPAMSLSSPSSFVSTEWIAHDGLITSMAARRRKGVTRSPPSSLSLPSPPHGSATTMPSPSNSSGSGNSSSHGDAGRERGDGATAAPDCSTDDGVELSESEAPAVATGGGDGIVRVWTDEGMTSRMHNGGDGGNGESSSGEEWGNRRRRSVGNAQSGAAVLAPPAVPVGGRSGHQGAVLCVCWHPKGELLASAGQDWAIWLWDAVGGALSYVHADQRFTRMPTLSDSGEFLASCSAGGGSAGWAVALSETSQVLTIPWKHPKRLIATRAEVGISRTSSRQVYRDEAWRWKVVVAGRARVCCFAPALRAAHLFRRITPLPSFLTFWLFSTPQKRNKPSSTTRSTFRPRTHQALSDHGASTTTGPPATPDNAVALATASGVTTPMSVVCTTLHEHIRGADWTVDGVLSLIRSVGDDDLEARNSEGMAVLLLALQHRRGHVVETLLAAGADSETLGERGYTAACWVREKNKRETGHSSCWPFNVAVCIDALCD